MEQNSFLLYIYIFGAWTQSGVTVDPVSTSHVVSQTTLEIQEQLKSALGKQEMVTGSLAM